MNVGILDKPYGDVTLHLNNILDSSALRLNLYGTYFSTMENTNTNPTYPFLVNTITSAIFHADYFDYYKSAGWRTGLTADYKFISADGYIEMSKQDSLRKTTNNSIFSSSLWRDNPTIIPGDYFIASGGISLNSTSFLRNTSFNVSLKLNGMYGEIKEPKTLFRSMDAELQMDVPTFYTGYSPMLLELIIAGGKSCPTTPYQYQFRMPTRLNIIGQSGVFYSAPIGIYGGNRYFACFANYNLTDLWWRAIGLPRYEGRGIDLILAGSAGKYYTPSGSYYKGTDNQFYSELGFGLSRIPTFISNVGYLSFDARWGLGPVAHGSFGWGIGLSLPF